MWWCGFWLDHHFKAIQLRRLPHRLLEGNIAFREFNGQVNAVFLDLRIYDIDRLFYKGGQILSYGGYFKILRRGTLNPDSRVEVSESRG